MKSIRAFTGEVNTKFIAKDPQYFNRIILQNGGVIETMGGTDIISVSEAGVVAMTHTTLDTSTITSASASALAVGLNGATNPALQVDASTASSATGIKVKSAAVTGGAAVSVVSSGTNEPLTIDAKGSGTVTIAGTSTGAVTITPATTITGALTNTGATYANGGVDRSTAAALAIGATNATSVVITPATTITGAATFSSSAKSTSATAGVGYGTGAGGTVIQITNRSTGVTIDKVCGTIQTDTTSLAAGASAEFTVTNSAVAIGDVVVVSQRSGSSNAAGVAGTTHVHVVTVANGSFIISVDNNSSTTAETGAIIINFAVIKAVAA